MIDELAGPKTYHHYPVGWAYAMDTLQWTLAGEKSSPRQGSCHPNALQTFTMSLLIDRWSSSWISIDRGPG